MNNGALRGRVLAANLAAFGVAVTVQWPEPYATQVATTGVWIHTFAEGAPVGGVVNRREPRRLMALPKSAVPTLPLKTLIVAPDTDGVTLRGWRVDAYEDADADHYRVVLVRYDDALVLVT